MTEQPAQPAAAKGSSAETAEAYERDLATIEAWRRSATPPRNWPRQLVAAAVVLTVAAAMWQVLASGVYTDLILSWVERGLEQGLPSNERFLLRVASAVLLVLGPAAALIALFVVWIKVQRWAGGGRQQIAEQADLAVAALRRERPEAYRAHAFPGTVRAERRQREEHDREDQALARIRGANREPAPPHTDQA